MNLNTYSPVAQANLLADMRLGSIRHRMVRIEDNAQDFTLVNEHGDLVNLFDRLENSSIVLAFINGGETIEDQTMLCELGKMRSSLNALDASLLVIAPHSKALDEQRSQCEKLNTEILHDVSNHVAYQYGLVPEPVYSTKENYEDFTNNHWSNEEPLPVTAIYVITPNRRIAFSYAHTGSTFGLNKQELLATLSQRS